jgi:rhodanese-related sulfurtransferase
MVPEVDVAELARQRAVGAPILDVREPDEYEAGHVPGAELIPLGEVAERTPGIAGEVPGDATLYIICKSGGRSRRAAEHLRANGVDAVNVAGGTLAWIEAGYDLAAGPAPG